MILVDDNDDIDDNNEKEKFHIFMTLPNKNSVFDYMTPRSLLLI